MAIGAATFTDISGAVGDLFNASGARLKAEGDFDEAQAYGEASTLAKQNAQFTQESTAIQEFQSDRKLFQTLGSQRAEVAGSGFQESGSALDLLRSSAEQGALQHAVLGQQGLITEAGYKEQASSYTLMQDAANKAGQAEESASTGFNILGAVKGVAALATLF